jgi:hypothetical protein
MKINAEKLEELCAKIADLTDSNEHTQALLEIAKFFKIKHFINIFQAIITIADEEGGMVIGEYRSATGKRLLNCIKQEYGQEVYEKINNSR